MTERAAIGLVPHTGWTWLVRVRVGSAATAPVAEARLRLTVLDVVAAELLHLARDHAGDRAAFFADRREEALAGATEMVTAHLAGARVAVVLGKRPPLPPLDRIVASHPMIHTAEGELWRALFAESLEHHGLRVERTVAASVRPGLDARHGAERVDSWLLEAGRGLGAPWGMEPRLAALAAWSVLDRDARPGLSRPGTGTWGISGARLMSAIIPPGMRCAVLAPPPG